MEIQSADKGGLTFKANDFAQDIQKLAVEQGLPDPYKEEAPPAVAMPAQPPQAAVTPTEPAKQETTPEPKVVEVPEKFKTADGKVDEAKLEKSIVNVDQALAKYLEKEKELKRKINEVKTAENAYLNPVNVAPTTEPVQTPANLPFRQMLAKDIQEQGIEVVLEKLFTASQEAALDQARKELSPLKQGFEEATTRSQVEAIGKADPWVYTEDGISTLNQILTQQPYLMQAPDPYKAAYIHYQGQRGVTQKVEHSSQVSTPTPTAKASAPVPTAVAASNANTSPTINLDSPQAVDAYLKTLDPKQQEEFFVKMGLPAFAKRY